jgi:hypothetical protein
MAVVETIVNMVRESPIIFTLFLYLFILSFFLKGQFQKSAWFYVLLIVVPFIVGMIYTFSGDFTSSISNLVATASNLLSIKTALFAVVALAALGFFIYISETETGSAGLSYGAMIIGILFALTWLVIFYKRFQAYIYNMKGWWGFIVNFILFIPCLISDMFEYLYGDFKITPKIVFITLFIELVIVLLYIYVPKIAKKMQEQSGKIIIDKPERINLKKDITNYIDMQSEKPAKKTLTAPDREVMVRKRFALSMWVYIVPMPPNHAPYNKTANILNFAYHPRIAYNGTNKKFSIDYNTQDADTFEAPTEKWNHIVVNYDKDTVDMFLNGELKSTIPRQKANETFSVGDILTIGQNNGLQGGIAKVLYFEQPLLSFEIQRMYKLQKGVVGTE